MTKPTVLITALALTGCATATVGQQPRSVSASEYGYKRPSVDAVPGLDELAAAAQEVKGIMVRLEAYKKRSAPFQLHRERL